jgi:hypothetical protein
VDPSGLDLLIPIRVSELLWTVCLRSVGRELIGREPHRRARVPLRNPARAHRESTAATFWGPLEATERCTTISVARGIQGRCRHRRLLPVERERSGRRALVDGELRGKF